MSGNRVPIFTKITLRSFQNTHIILNLQQLQGKHRILTKLK